MIMNLSILKGRHLSPFSFFQLFYLRFNEALNIGLRLSIFLGNFVP
jgi:hypothetical protein